MWTTIWVIFLSGTVQLISAELASQPTASTSFVINDDGVLYGWGRNDRGQVGNGSASVSPPFVSTPFAIMPPPGALGWKRVSAASEHTLAIADNDQLYAWGFNGSGRLGTGHSTNELSPALVSLPAGVSAWRAVAAGGAHSLAIGDDGKVYAWGTNDWGQLGTAEPGDASVPVAVDLPAESGGWQAVAAGNEHSIALSQRGLLYFWGRSVGVDDVATSMPPTQIPAPEGANSWKAIGAGYNHSFAIADNGKLYGWGANESGQLGTASTNSVDTPAPVMSTRTNWLMASGGLLTSIALEADGRMWEWGRRPTGESGLLSNVPPREVPHAACANGWKSCTAGYLHKLAVGSNCKLFGWGDNEYRQWNPSGEFRLTRSPSEIYRLGYVCLNQENRPPSIYVNTRSPVYNSPARIEIFAAIYDCEANVETVTFYEGNNVLSVLTLEPTNSPETTVSLVWSNVTAGTYAISASAVDAFGASATSFPETVTVYKFTNGITDIRSTTNGAELAEALLAWDCGGLRVQSAIVSAQTSEAGMSIGIFQTTPPLGVAYGLGGPGVVISTGNAADYKTGVSSSTAFTTAYKSRATTEQETTLDEIDTSAPMNFAHFDVTELSLHFDVLPGNDLIKLGIIFGSEEFPEFLGTEFIDTFGILLNGTNIAYFNGLPINPFHPEMRGIAGTELDGVLAPGNNPQVVLCAPVEPGSSNNVLTFILADTMDANVDTTVFLSELRAVHIEQHDAELRLDIAPTAADEHTLQMSGIPCGQVVIESSPDLSQWTAVSTNTATAGSVRVKLIRGGNSTFFRARRLR